MGKFHCICIAAGALLLAQEPWNSVAGLRRVLPAGGKLVGYWRSTDAAFAAVSVPERGIASVVRLDGGEVEVIHEGSSIRTGAKATRISSLDLVGVRVGANVVLFHTEKQMARSALSFDTGTGEGRLGFIVTGLAPGIWEVWRNGWLVEPEVVVRAGEAVLFFEERPGSYFIRRLS